VTSTPLLPALLRSDRAPAPRTLVEIFTETAEACPDALAVDSGVDVLTYAELAEAALSLAARLAEIGVRAGDKVGVRVRSGTTDLYVAILGVLHAGAAYVPVDADDPDERARVVFAESRAVAVVGDGLAIASTVSPASRPPVRRSRRRSLRRAVRARLEGLRSSRLETPSPATTRG
jgi:non-ribosomal peptide synthetase component F